MHEAMRPRHGRRVRMVASPITTYMKSLRDSRLKLLALNIVCRTACILYLSSVRHQLKFNQTIVCNCYCTLLLFGVLLPFIFLLSFIFLPPFMLPPRPPPLKPPGLLPKPPALDAPMVPADCVQFVNEESSQ